jgi:hypothetical protein
MYSDDGSVWGLVLALALIPFVWFVVIPSAGSPGTSWRTSRETSGG